MLVTDPEIIEDAYDLKQGFDNPCFQDITPAVGVKKNERVVSSISTMETPATKDPTTRWSSPWSSLGLGSGNRSEKRRTLDDSCLGVSVNTLHTHQKTHL